MKRIDAKLITPIYVHSGDGPWPQEPVFYLLTADGLLLCRNNPFYTSAVKAPRWPTELVPQREFLRVAFPRMPQALAEQAVGFFQRAYKERGAESVVLLAWDRQERRVEIVVPKQRAVSYRTARGDVYAESVRYDPPAGLPPQLVVYGDVHSHCDMAAYASAVDKADEVYASGLHVVVGRLDNEPPEFHVEASVDGARFGVERRLVIEGYQARRFDFPDDWLRQHTVDVYGHAAGMTPSSSGSAGPDGYYTGRDEPPRSDKHDDPR